MSRTLHAAHRPLRLGHRSFLSLPRDYMARRRVRRRISNAILIPLLSGVAAYFITHQTGGSGFSLPKTQRQAPLSTPLRSASLVAHDEAHDNASTPWAARRRALLKALSQAQ